MKKLIFILLCLPFIFVQEVEATHLVGGEMRYQCLGGDQYRIFLTVRRDCFNGAPNAQFDDPAYITVYEPNGGIIDELGQSGVFNIPLRKDDTLNEILTSTCKVIGPDVCVHTTTYFFDVQLRPRRGGYMFVYQRCCLNNTLLNIENPLETGLTLTTIITEAALARCNSSPVLTQWPSIYLCKDDTIRFDHSATDRNGDSIVYRLCTPFQGASAANSKPTKASTPPYSSVVWRAPYGINNLMGGWPLRVNSQTGEITGAPNLFGQFLVGVCMEEYRNGELLSVSQRVFEYNVRECPERPIADFETDGVACEGFTIDFTNTSSGTSYLWYFDYLNDRSLTSTERDPSFTYSAPGIYNVGLISIRDSTCEDSTFQQVVIYGDEMYKADFDFLIDECEDEIVLLLEDKSYDSLFSIEGIEWTIISSDTVITSNLKNERIVFLKDDTITVRLIATTEFGCMDTLEKVIPVNLLNVDFIADEIVICNGDSTDLVANPNTKFQYNWSPAIRLSCADCPNPVAYPNGDAVYVVTVTDGLCSVVDTVKVKVNEELLLQVSGDTIACQRVVELSTNGGEPAATQWSRFNDFSLLLDEGKRRINVNVDSVLTVYVRSATSSGCEGMDSITIIREEVFFDAVDSLKYCEGDTFTVSVTNLIPGHDLEYQWTPTANILSGQGTANPVFTFPNSGIFALDFVATNQFDCDKSGRIIVEIVDLPKINFDQTQSCEDLLVNFENLSEDGDYIWYFGDGDTSHSKNPIHEYPGPGKYVVTLSVQGFCYDEVTDTIEVGIIEYDLADTLISCAGEPVQLNPNPDLSYSYVWSPKEFLNDETLPNPTATVVSTTIFRVTITDNTYTDCFVEREVLVLVTEPIEFTTTPDTLLCYSDTIDLMAMGDYQYCWFNSNGDTIAVDNNMVTVLVDDEETFTVVAKDIYGCDESKTLTVKRFNLNVEIEEPDTICFMDAVRLKITNLGEGNLTYSWSPTEYILEGEDTDSPLVSPDVTTTFTVIITNEDGCIYERSVEVAVDRVDPRPVITIDPDTIIITQSTQLQVIPDDYSAYRWVPEIGLSCTDCPDPMASPEETTTYTVYVENERGCLDSATVRVVVIRPNCDESDIYVPNAFSPNGDGINDVWFVRSNFITDLEVYVYNRWGEKVFESKNQSVGWDGTFEGEFLRPDVYGYYIHAICVDQSEYTTKGNLTLIK